MNSPCISVIVTNYNYGKFLERCILSILNQDYENIELIICDNGSTDESMAIINKYLIRDPSRITVLRHRHNIGSAANFISGYQIHRGDYYINMGADDYLDRKYLKKAIDLFEKYPTVSQIVSHAESIDDEGKISQRAPFFDGSYLIPGLLYAPILMVAGITSHTSQMILCSARDRSICANPECITSTKLGERTTSMMHAIKHDVIYLNSANVTCRDSNNNETAKLNQDISQIIEQYIVINEYSSYAKRHDLKMIYERKDEAIAKLADLCSRYSAEFLRLGKTDIAGKYLGLQLLLEGSFDKLLIKPELKINKKFNLKLLSNITKSQEMSGNEFNVRRHSYRPPENSIKLYV